MPIHDWTRVGAFVFSDFRLSWTVSISALFNTGGLPSGYYSLVEQHRTGFGFELADIGSRDSDDERSERVWELRRRERMSRESEPAPLETYLIAEDDLEPYRRAHKTVTIRDESDHEVVAAVEIVSPADKYSPRAMRLLVEKAGQFLERGIHVLIVDIYPPGKHDPRGVHGAIWEEITGQSYTPTPDKPFTLASYESQATIRAYVEPVAVGDSLPEMPLFLRLGDYVMVPLEETYQRAWKSMARTWRDVIEGRR